MVVNSMYAALPGIIASTTSHGICIKSSTKVTLLPKHPQFSFRSPCIQPPRLRVCGSSINHASHELKEAKEAVSLILQDAGLSRQKSIEIVSVSSYYIKMLIESVKELDEASLWRYRGFGRDEADNLSFREKIAFIANEKGDKGILPYLESININRSSLTAVAKYLSSAKLPVIIDKVQYMKKILTSCNLQEVQAGKRVREMIMLLSVPADDDIQRAFSFFEKLASRQGGFNILDSVDTFFPYLLECFPSLLSLSIDSDIKPLIACLEAAEISSRSVGFVLLSFPSIFFHDIDKEIKPRLEFLKKIGGSNIGKMVIRYPWALSRSIQANYKQILSFFEKAKVPSSCVKRAICRFPHLLGCSTHMMKLLMDQFAQLGIGEMNLAKILASSPQLLARKPHEFSEVVSFFQDHGFKKRNIGRLLCSCPKVFASSIEGTLKKKVDALAEFGFSETFCPRVLQKCPVVLLQDFLNTTLPRLEYLVNAGLSKSEVIYMAEVFPPLLGYSIEKVLQPKLVFLTNTMKKQVKDLVQYPRYFSYSLDGKIKPRFQRLEHRGAKYSLEEMLGKSDDEFSEFLLSSRQCCRF